MLELSGALASVLTLHLDKALISVQVVTDPNFVAWASASQVVAEELQVGGVEVAASVLGPRVPLR